MQKTWLNRQKDLSSFPGNNSSPLNGSMHVCMNVVLFFWQKTDNYKLIIMAHSIQIVSEFDGMCSYGYSIYSKKKKKKEREKERSQILIFHDIWFLLSDSISPLCFAVIRIQPSFSVQRSKNIQRGSISFKH